MISQQAGVAQNLCGWNHMNPILITYWVEPLEEAVENWTDKCNVSSDGKIWLQCNNWYMKGTKDDQSAGRSRSKSMWMESHESYLNHLLGGADGHQDDLLKFS
jgi:hypothetical protein